MSYRSLAWLVWLCSACSQQNSSSTSPISSAQVINTQEEGGNFVLLVVEEGEVGQIDAKQIAREKAAELTVENGFRYFQIVSEYETQVVKNTTDWSTQEGYTGNLYEELIVEDDFGKEGLEERTRRQTDVLPAWRLEFTPLATPLPGCQDSCDYIPCK